MKSKFNQERRDVLKGACVLAGATAMVTIGGSLPAFAEQKDVPQVGDVFVFCDGTKKGKIVTVDDVVVNADPLSVQAATPDGKPREGDNYGALLYRTDKAKVDSDMANDTIDGIMAYSSVCTHQGCILSTLHHPDNLIPKLAFICPCHDALFAPLQGGKNVGGAETRTLPHFPIKADGGKIVISDVPSSYVGVKRGY